MRVSSPAKAIHLAGDNAYADPGFDVNGNPVFTPISGLQTDRSDYVLGAYVAPWSFLQLISQSRFDQSSFALAPPGCRRAGEPRTVRARTPSMPT